MAQKRDLWTHEGVWCIADMETELYETLTTASQAKNPWAYQAEYGKFMVYFLVVVLALFILKRLYFSYIDEEDIKIGKHIQRPSIMSKMVAFNRYICYRRIPIAICEFLCLPCTLGNCIVLAGTFLYVLCYALIPKIWYRACRGFGSPPLAVRAGFASLAFIPFIIILSGKSNIISTAIGVGYEKVNVYHRWLSIICFTLMWIHIIPFYVQGVREGGMARVQYFMETNAYFVNGIPPTVFFTWLCFGSYTPIRRWWYEMFLHLHWICGLGFIIGLYIHVWKALGSEKYLHATIACWITQLIWRLFTKTCFKPGKSFLKSKPSKATKFLVTAGNRTNESFEILIDNKDEEFKWNPGQHLFVRIPGIRILDNHPFSIANVPQDGNIKLVIKPQKGLTRKIFSQIPDNMTKDMKIYIDGPYGGTYRDYHSFDKLFLFATGSGVTCTLPFLLETSKSMENRATHLDTVVMNWMVQFGENIDWIKEELRTVPQELLQSGKIVINIYGCYESENSPQTTTKDSSDSDLDTNEEKNFINISELTDLPGINYYNYKPKVAELVNNLRLGNKNIVISSGSDSMKNQVGNRIAALQSKIWLRNSRVREIYLHTESFDW